MGQVAPVRAVHLLATCDCSSARWTGPLVTEVLSEDACSRRERECLRPMVLAAAHGAACRKTW